MKKVLFITSTFPRSKDEVWAKWIGELAVRLKDDGEDVSVFAPSFRGLPSHVYRGINVTRFRYAPSGVEVLTQEKGAVFKLKKNPFLFFLVPLFFFFGFWGLIKLLRKNNYQVIHVHWPFPMGLFGLLAKYINKGSLVLTFYGAEFSLIRKVPFGSLITKYVIKSADKVTAISTYTAELVKKIMKVPVVVIPYTSTFTLGQSTTGPLFKELEDLVLRLRLEGSVDFKGKISDRELILLYKNCDVFVLPSITDKWGDTEGLGVVLLEAMGFGKPVIASRIGGITDIVKHEYTGLRVEQKNIRELSQAVIRVLQNDKFARGLAENGYEYFKTNFNWNSTIKKTQSLYV